MYDQLGRVLSLQGSPLADRRFKRNWRPFVIGGLALEFRLYTFFSEGTSIDIDVAFRRVRRIVCHYRDQTYAFQLAVPYCHSVLALRSCSQTSQVALHSESKRERKGTPGRSVSGALM